jgi:rSAM/selenodomain-associated transferase 1
VDRRPALLLFARAPEPGRVKTRLAPMLSAAGASALYRAFLSDASRLYGRNETWRPVLCADPAAEDPRLATLFPPPWQRRTQGPGDLGEKLRRAFEDAFASGAPRAVAVGSDHPTLPPGVLEDVLSALDATDAAIVPAEDGGYCAIGLGANRFSAQVFRDVPWSTRSVLDATLDRLRAAGLSCRLLAPHYDVDRPEDLERLRRELAGRDPVASDYPAATAACLAALEAAPAGSPS